MRRRWLRCVRRGPRRRDGTREERRRNHPSEGQRSIIGSKVNGGQRRTGRVLPVAGSSPAVAAPLDDKTREEQGRGRRREKTEQERDMDTTDGAEGPPIAGRPSDSGRLRQVRHLARLLRRRPARRRCFSLRSLPAPAAARPLRGHPFSSLSASARPRVPLASAAGRHKRPPRPRCCCCRLAPLFLPTAAPSFTPRLIVAVLSPGGSLFDLNGPKLEGPGGTRGRGRARTLIGSRRRGGRRHVRPTAKGERSRKDDDDGKRKADDIH